MEELRKLKKRFKHLVVVVGGGPIARSYINAARVLKANRSLQDILGLEAAKLNARLLIAGLGGEAYPRPPDTLEEALEQTTTGRIVVAGGFQPGQSTAMVAALLAEAINASKLLVASTVDGVYDRDPRRYPNAKLLRRLKYYELRRVLQQSVEPGHYELLDYQAISILERSCIKCVVFNGLEPRRLLEALEERTGTIIEC